jgi:hypothetical protein
MGTDERGSGVNGLSLRGVPAPEGGALVWAKAGAIEQAVAIKPTITRHFGIAASRSCQG